jgi:hypothetical protein
MKQLCIAVAVLIMNIALTMYASQRYGVENGMVDLYLGNCTTANEVNLMLHLLIALLSFLLVMAGNYCSQFLIAATRSEVDMAHQLQDWVDIGIPSLRNVNRLRRRISLRRCILWALLMSSSALLHLV